MRLDAQVCDRARLARDPRFDGLFFVGVLSTGIYCRPICPARSPKRENIVFFPSAAAAAAAGLRPCLRCRPESAPGSPAWNGTSTTVARAMMLIRQGALVEGGLVDLAAKLGVGKRHLRRLFQEHLGVSPKRFALTERTLFAKKLLSETALPVTKIALTSGFGSIRRFNAAFNKLYGKTPSAIRRRDPNSRPAADALFRSTLTLSYRPPLDWPGMLGFFQARAIPGVECVKDGVYHRTVRINGTSGVISVARAAEGHALRLTAALSDSRDLMPLVDRVRRMFDLNANMTAIHDVLSADPLLAAALRKTPGLRLPGAWDPFEVAVRAVTGQQVSVKGARTVLGRIAAKTGPRFESAEHPQLTRFFPNAEELTGCGLDAIGMPATRAGTIQALARAVADGELSFGGHGSLESFIARLTALPGIGDWTAQYIAMRALGEPDAFPASDLGIAKALQQGERRPSLKQILQRAESWRPWRAYAAMSLWHA
jgi:AraC family transcriptional regulator of adaptative response / DNA-3-methyladenine glycosylase II